MSGGRNALPFIALGDLDVYYDLSGPADAPVVVLANSLGTNVHVWDAQLGALATAYRVLRYELRGHGLSGGAARTPLTIAELAGDVARLLDALGLDRVTFVGLSIGGMIGQAFAAAYPDRVAALVLCATASRIGSPALWDARIAAVEENGMRAIVPGVLERWFLPRTHAERPALVRGFGTMLERTAPEGYVAACRAIREADLRAADAAVRCATLVVAGSGDVVTTPEMARELCAAIAEAEFAVIDAAHILCADAPAAFDAVLLRFLAQTSRVAHAR